MPDFVIKKTIYFSNTQKRDFYNTSIGCLIYELFAFSYQNCFGFGINFIECFNQNNALFDASRIIAMRNRSCFKDKFCREVHN